MHQSAGTHGARFNCSKQFTAFQTMVAEGGTGLAQRDNLGVRGGIGVGEIAVAAASDDFAVVNYHRADWDFAGFKRALGGAERFFHEEFVAVWLGISFGWRQRSTPSDVA
jgi:hypothetical protein